MSEQTGCVVGSELMEKNGWKLGQTIHLSGTIYPGDWPFTIRAVYHSQGQGIRRDQMLFFHWKYLYENGPGSQADRPGSTRCSSRIPGRRRNSRTRWTRCS